jgi:lipid-A-disaccharide synthase
MARALGQGALLLPRLVSYVAEQRHARAELEDDLRNALDVDPAPVIVVPRERQLSVFVSCAEVSGELHATNAVRELERIVRASGAPAPRFVGLGGSRLAAAGVEIIGSPVDRAQMGLGVLGSIPWYARLLRDAAARLRQDRPDVLFAVDSPALHVPLARIAARYGVPTVHFVTPQYWGWAPWRVRGYRRSIDRALAILPFESRWYARHGLLVSNVGHPLLDELAAIPATAPPEDARELVILPGSRAAVIERNLPWMLRVASSLRARLGDVPVVVAHERVEIGRAIKTILEREKAADWARAETGDLHGVLARARTALSVSGTVLLDLLHHSLPTVVVYRLAHGYEARLKDRLLTVPWFSSVNLLAGREIYPEFCFAGEGPIERVVDALARLHKDPVERKNAVAGLQAARRRLGPPGACGRAARHALEIALRAEPAA